MLTEAILRKMWPQGDKKVPGLVHGIAASAPAVFAKYGIKDDAVIAQMMAQFSHECGAGLEMTENINYTAERAAEVWPSRFKNAADCYAKVGSYPGDPDFHGKLIDSVYGTRMGNRPGTHDGRNYIGRGLSQVTGREGYQKLGEKISLPLLDQPGLVTSPEHALEAGVADFILCGCLPYAERDDVIEVTKHLNGGTVGLAERKEWLARWRVALQGSPPVPARVEPPATPATAPKPVPPSRNIPVKPVAAGMGVAAALAAAGHYIWTLIHGG
jgi:putative chitinase